MKDYYYLYQKLHNQMFGNRGVKKHKLFKGLTHPEVEYLEAAFERSFYFCADSRYLGKKKWALIVRRAPKDESVP